MARARQTGRVRARATSIARTRCADAEARLAEVSGDAAFARDFFARYIQGHEVADYAPLLRARGLRRCGRRNAGPRVAGRRASRGADGGVRVAIRRSSGTPAYAAGLEQDDEIRQIDGERVTSVRTCVRS